MDKKLNHAIHKSAPKLCTTSINVHVIRFRETSLLNIWSKLFRIEWTVPACVTCILISC